MKTLFKEIEAHDTIIIHRHVRPDPDALGSQAGLAYLIKDNYPEKRIYMVGEEVESLKFLAQMDQIPDHLYENALVIVCDTANQERISDERYSKGVRLLKIDHHPNVDQYGDWMWVDTSVSSVSEMIASLYQQNPKLKLTDQAARVLYAGIVGDTGRFLYTNTTPNTHRLTAQLLEKAFNAQHLNDQMEALPLKLLRFQGVVLQKFEWLEKEGLGVMRITQSILREWEITAQEASSLVNLFSGLEGIRAWVFFVEETDQIRVRLRSKGPVINQLAAKYKGGGHPMASGASVYNWETCDQIVEELRTLCHPFIGK